MARPKKVKTDQNALLESLSTLPINEFLTLVATAGEAQKQDLKPFVSDMVNHDIQQHLDELDIEPECPECHSHNIRKNAKRKHIQKYICMDCGKNFSSTTGTLLEKTHYTWSAWVRLIFCMLNKESLKDTQQTLADDLKCIKIDEKTVRRMRLKVMNAVRSLPSPTLTGIIQIDDTFFRENQKGQLELENPLPEDMGIVREPRHHYTRSEMGTRGNEFATATCAIDSNGHAVIRALGMGAIKPETMKGFFDEHMQDISYICSDADRTYQLVCDEMGLPHYIKPSTYLTTLQNEGYESPSRVDIELADQQREHDNYILERLYNNGEIDRIENVPAMSWHEFVDTKYANRLGIGKVDNFHKEMKKYLRHKMTGVGTQYLPYYLAWYEYTYNLKVDRGCSIVSEMMAEEILKALVKTRTNITESEWKALRTGETRSITAKASGKYMHALKAKTDEVIEATGDHTFRFEAEDGVETFDLRKQLYALHISKLKILARKVKLKGRAQMNKKQLVENLRVMPETKQALLELIAEEASIRDDRQSEAFYVRKRGRKQMKPEDKTRRTRQSTFAKRLFAKADDVTDDEKVLFFDTETTGTVYKTDEVLSLGVVDNEGTVLFDKMFRPRNHKTWNDAMEINHITPEMTIGKPSLKSYKSEIEDILARDAVLVGWNVQFDMRMLYAGGVDMPMTNGKYVDLMKEFKRAYKTVATVPMKRQYTLAEAVDIVGAKNKKPHDAVADSSVLIDIWKWTRETLEAA